MARVQHPPAPSAALRRDLIAFALFAAIGCGLIAAANHASRSYYPEGEIMARMFERSFARVAQAQVLVVGGSLSGGIRFEGLDAPGEHLHFPAGDIFEAEAALDLALPRAEDVRAVIVTVGASTLFLENGGRAGQAHRRRTAFHALTRVDPAAMVGGDVRGAVATRLTPLMRHDRWMSHRLYLANRLRGRPTSDDEAYYARAAPEDGRRRYDERTVADWAPGAVARNAAATAAFVAERAEMQTYCAPDVAARVEASLHRMTRAAAAHGAVLVIAAPPITPDGFAAEQATFPYQEARLQAALDRLRRAGAIVYDDRGLAELSGDPALFRDSYHLNGPGGERYGRLLGERLRADAILPPPDA